MTISEAIAKLDNFKHNSYTEEDKIGWLSTVDGRVQKLILETHEGAEDLPPFTGYDTDTPEDTVLLVPEPFSVLYLRWLEACVDYANGEYDKYNNSMTMYNTELQMYEIFYNRTHLPLKKGTRFIF